ncbi:MAG: amidohydrolase [Bacilli bacterium]
MRCKRGQADWRPVSSPPKALAEYDALPEIGHACGHNLIAAASLGAGLALAEEYQGNGQIRVIGCPAEEGGGGKIRLLEQGVFEDLDAALMFHPGNETVIALRNLGIMGYRFDFHGRAAHAAVAPERGINALEAVLLTFQGVNALRQHMSAGTRVHGIIIHGGSAPNVVPEFASTEFLIRAATLAELENMRQRVENCARGAALATGAELTIHPTVPQYEPIRVNETISTVFGQHASALGVTIERLEGQRNGSTDLGNVSYRLPVIHPVLRITPDDVVNHSQAFAEQAASPEAFEVSLVAAKALARTGLDLLRDENLLRSAHEEWRRVISS